MPKRQENSHRSRDPPDDRRTHTDPIQESLIDIYVDGTLRETVDATSATRVYDQTVFSTGGLAPGEHTLKGVMRTGGYLIVDAFTVRG
ncbi:hypothetical protein [Streptomyces beijiangensis]|uniref:Uncharacterized protein n=1 Tax=Streptomyces beijiangensis TaxID=163361 RepID=A0A939F564_9ACTN|nr:hypothetical protein [Streptomyces beijiangensis]MBO0512098.1 hypothetical protein [Streptomyces beijiangensis]